jgi:hypothetical protein
MTSLASKIRLKENCAADYALQNPLVLQASIGLSAYTMMFQAGCEKDHRGYYCFANAITNENSTSDSYPYFLPLGNPMPTGPRPTCSNCLRKTMQIFASAASNPNQAISKTYSSAAEQINNGCGKEWVQQQVAMTSGATRTSSLSATLMLLMLLPILFLQ